MNPLDQNNIAQRLNMVETSITNQILTPHVHNGTDMNRVNFLDLALKRHYLSHTIYGTGAATAANYGVFFIAPILMRIASVREVHQTAASDGSAVTLNIEKLTSTQATGGGVVVLSAGLSLKATANIVQSGVLSTTLPNINLAIGDRLALKEAGVLTAVANVTVLIELIF